MKLVLKQAGVLLAGLALLSNVSCGSRAQTPSRAPQQPTPAQDKERLARFARQLEDLRAKLKIPGLSAAIVRNQQVLWAKGFGFADPQNKIPAAPDTPYRIASLTKTFASMLALQLIEQGKLDLDEPIAKYSVEFQNNFKNAAIKVRHVFTHTSHGDPGASYRYDGNRFSYLTEVIEKAAGQPFRTLLAQNILDKLGMHDSVPGQNVLDERAQATSALGAENVKRYERALSRLAKPHRLYGTEIIPTVYPSRRISASAGLISTVLDLAKYDAAIDRHLFIKPETQARAWTPAVATGGQTLPYGLGWFVQQHQGVRLVWHYGYWPDSFSALLVKAPKQNVTFILLANSDGLSAPFNGLGRGDVTSSAFALEFLRLFVYEDRLGRMLPDPPWSPAHEQFQTEIARLQTEGYRYERESDAHDDLSDWLNARRAGVRREIKLDPKIYDAYLGQYELRPGRVMTISRQGDKLIGQMPGEAQVELFPEAETKFFLKVIEAQLQFIKDEKGQVTHLELRQWGQTMRGGKVK